MNKCWRGCGETGPLSTQGRNVKWFSSWNTSMMAPQRNRITTWSSNSTSRYTPKRTERGVLRYCVSVFRAAQFTRAKRWKCLQMDEHISKRWLAHIIEYYSTFKRREIPQYATMWMNLEDMMLSETIQVQKDISGNLTHTRSLKAVRIREQVRRVSRAGRRRGRSSCLVGVAFILQPPSVMEMSGGDLHNNVGVFNTTEPCTSLAVQWSGRGAFTAGVWSLVRKLSSRKPRGVAKKINEVAKMVNLTLNAF